MLRKQIFTLIIIVLVLAGCSQDKATEDNQEVIAARLVKTAPVQQKDVMEYLSYSGMLEAEQAVNITPAISAEVVEINVDEGDFVEKGFLLARLDDTELKQAKLQYDMLKKNFQKISNLYDSGSIDEGTYDETSTAYNAAKEAYEFLLENTEIRAPYPGVISAVAVKETEIYSSMAMPYLMRLVNLSEIKGSVHISETDLNLLEIGNDIYLTTDATHDEVFAGKLSFISPEADAFSGTYMCQFTVDNDEGALRHNQFCRVKLVTAKSENTLSVPPSAVIDDKMVMINVDGVAKAVAVETGLENEFEVEIVSGLKGGEEVIYVGNLGLEEGNKLQVNE